MSYVPDLRLPRIMLKDTASVSNSAAQQRWCSCGVAMAYAPMKVPAKHAPAKIRAHRPAACARDRAIQSLPAFACDVMDKQEAVSIEEQILAMNPDEFEACMRDTYFFTGRYIVGYNTAYGWYKSLR